MEKTTLRRPAILRNEVGWFDEEEHNSTLVAARLATDATDVKSAIADRISVILQNMTSLLISFIVGFVIEWRVSLLILGTFPLLVLANFAQVTFDFRISPSAVLRIPIPPPPPLLLLLQCVVSLVCVLAATVVEGVRRGHCQGAREDEHDRRRGREQHPHGGRLQRPG